MPSFLTLQRAPALSNTRIPLALRDAADHAALGLINAEVKFMFVDEFNWPACPNAAEDLALLQHFREVSDARAKHKAAWQALWRAERELDIAASADHQPLTQQHAVDTGLI